MTSIQMIFSPDFARSSHKSLSRPGETFDRFTEAKCLNRTESSGRSFNTRYTYFTVRMYIKKIVFHYVFSHYFESRRLTHGRSSFNCYYSL